MKMPNILSVLKNMIFKATFGQYIKFRMIFLEILRYLIFNIQFYFDIYNVALATSHLKKATSHLLKAKNEQLFQILWRPVVLTYEDAIVIYEPQKKSHDLEPHLKIFRPSEEKMIFESDIPNLQECHDLILYDDKLIFVGKFQNFIIDLFIHQFCPRELFVSFFRQR